MLELVLGRHALLGQTFTRCDPPLEHLRLAELQGDGTDVLALLGDEGVAVEAEEALRVESEEVPVADGEMEEHKVEHLRHLLKVEGLEGLLRLNVLQRDLPERLEHPLLEAVGQSEFVVGVAWRDGVGVEIDEEHLLQGHATDRGHRRRVRTDEEGHRRSAVGEHALGNERDEDMLPLERVDEVDDRVGAGAQTAEIRRGQKDTTFTDEGEKHRDEVVDAEHLE